MAFTVQHKRSAVEGKRPDPLDLAEGQVGVNTNYNQPGIFIKASDDSMVKIGPVAVSAGAPTLDTGSSYCTGELWLDITGNVNQLHVWDGFQWRRVSA